jgi:hypothetical protein
MPRRHVAQLGLGSRPRRDREARAYPRPLLERAEWTSLDGVWAFAIDSEAIARAPEDVRFDSRIEVPFAPETRRSGIGNNDLNKACWYRREFTIPEAITDEHVLLHFGAVDYEATVWVDGKIAVRHEGGYTPFSADITTLLRSSREHEIVVRAEDDPSDLAKPRGKQDWQLEPHSIWYPRTTGIWQSVWMERLGRAYLRSLRWTPHVGRWEIAIDAQVSAPSDEPFWLIVRLHVGDVLLAEDRYAVAAGEVHRRIALSDPGIDDFRNEFLWTPARPTLIDAELELVDADGDVVDAIKSYTALRSFSVEGGRLILNGRPYPLRMVLDQGYWPDTGLTAPDDGALRRDVELTKMMGFNAARKHQKLENPRYLYWADHFGLLVWGEMPSAYRFTQRSIERLTKQWMEALRRDVSHPCIVAWVPFNESWGVPNLPESQPERHYVEALYHLTKTIDPTRPVIGNDGWESVATDIIGIHDYDSSPERIAARYATPELLPKILERERPGGRALVVDERRIGKVPVVLSEFGGIAIAKKGDGGESGSAVWGYSSVSTPRELGSRYRKLLEGVRSCELFAGFCYTQLTDTYQEANGLLRGDRTPKIPLEEIAAATMGQHPDARSSAASSTTSLVEGVVTERDGAP